MLNGTDVLAVVDVHETEYRLDPSAIGFERIGYFGIRAFNDGESPHALAVSGPGVKKRTGMIQPGKSAGLVMFFRTPGCTSSTAQSAITSSGGWQPIVRVR